MASVWETDLEKKTIRWLDAIPVEVGVGDESSCAIIVKTSEVTIPLERGGEKSRRRVTLSIQARIALRQIVDTKVELPKCRRWEGVIDHTSILSNTQLVQEVVQKSLIATGGIAGSGPPAATEARSNRIWTSIMSLVSFVDALAEAITPGRS